MPMIVGEVTHITVKNGNWSDPTVWNTGTVPAAGHIAQIEHDVTYDAITPTGSYTRTQIEAMRLDLANLDANHALISPFALRGIQVRNGGTMKWATSETFLLVDTFYADAGSIEIGTEANPIPDSATAGKPRAEIMFIGQHDPGPMMTLGFTTKNTRIRMWGQEKTPDLRMAAANAGANSITLDAAPVNWKVGDTILISGTVIPTTEANDPHYTGPTTYWGPRHAAFGDVAIGKSFAQLNQAGFVVSQDEVRTISDIQGAEVSFATPLAYSHIVRTETLPDGQVKTLKPRAAMLTRSIQFTGFCTHEKGAGSNRRGHTMHMFSADIVRKHVRYLDLGRTRSDATMWIPGENDNTTGIRVSSGGAFIADNNNRRGRYPSHLHWCGWTFHDRAVIDEGLVIDSSPNVGFLPGWSYTQHNSRAHVKNVLAYRYRGAGLVAETGKEIGQWEDCGSVYGRSDGFPLQQFGDRAEFIANHNGHAGIGFDNQSRQLINRRCWGSGMRYAFSWRQQKTAPMGPMRSPESTALRMVDPITNNMNNTAGDHSYDASLMGYYGHQQVEIPDFFENEVTGAIVGIKVDGRDFMDHGDVMPAVFKSNLIVANKPYHIAQYSQNYINLDSVFWGPGLGVEQAGIEIGTKTFAHSFANCRFVDFKYAIDSGSLNFNGELFNIAGNWTQFEKVNTYNIETPDPALHAQNDAYGFTQTGTQGNGNAIVRVRDHVNYSPGTLPSPHPGTTFADADPEPGRFPELRFYELTGQQHTQSIGPTRATTSRSKDC